MYNFACSALITNCTFSGNKAPRYGGGIYNLGIVSPTLINCTFSGNVADYGGGMYSYVLSPPTVTNCIFWGNTPEQIIGDAIVTYSDVQGGWAGTGNIDSDPCFADINNPDGNDGIFGTWDDGLRLTIDSNCINAADGNAAPSNDILGFGRFDVGSVDNNGVGDPNYADMGAYEYPPVIVVMCWIDESYYGGGPYYSDPILYDRHLGQYQNLVSSVPIVKSGCLVPPNTDPKLTQTIADVLPEDYDPPPEISVETCGRPPTKNELIQDFVDRICDGVVPDYLILIVDYSGSMDYEDIQPGYDEFKSWIEDEDNYLGTVIREQGFENQDWVNEITKEIQNLLDELYD